MASGTVSGTIIGTTSNEYIDVKIEWSSMYLSSLNLNASTVSARLYYKRNNTGFTTSGTGTFTISINGEKASTTTFVNITESDWVMVASHSVAVEHNDDGTKQITITASGSIPDTTLLFTTISGKVDLYPIPRASTIDSLSCATAYFNGEMTYKFTPKSINLYNRCNISLNLNGEFIAVRSINLGNPSASQKTATVTLSESELSTIYNKLPKATKGVIRFTLRTYSDSGYSTQVGDAGYKELTLNIPNDTTTKPSVAVSLAPSHSLTGNFANLYVQGKSKLKATITSSGKYGATITNQKMVVDGKTYDSDDSFTSGYLLGQGTIAVKITVTDSRGFSQTVTKNISVLAYTKPKVIPVSGESAIICARCDANGNLNETGTYLKIKVKRSYSLCKSDGVQKNFCSIRYRYKVDGGSWSSWITILADNATSDEVTTGALLGTLETTKSYSVMVGVIDTIGEDDYTTIPIPTDKVYMHRAGSMNAFALGKYAEEENSFDVAQDITAIFRGDVRFMGEAWISRAIGTNVSVSPVNSGRWGGSGVYYRVCAGGKHVYVAFNVSFTTSSSTVRAESETIPFAPSYDVYALCPVGFSDGSRGIATVSVSPRGRVNIYAVHKLPGATLSTGDTVEWVDGYIDYWT